MQTFAPYIIHHLQLSEIDEILIPDENYYFVFWCNHVPLGHIWYNRDEKIITQLDLKLKINRALEAAISFYSRKCIDNECPEFLELLHKNEYRVLNAQLHELLLKLYNTGETSQKTVSIVICTRNRPFAIRACIESLITFANDKVEIIVVDNAPDDQRTRDVVSGFANVKYILEERKGLDIARNTGARYASHEIIAYTDDDVIVSPNWINVLTTCFDNPLTMAVTGLIIPLELNTEAQVIFESDWGFNKGYLPQVFDHGYFLERLASGVPAWDIGAGANMAFRKEAFLLAGWFDERLDVGASGCSGDSEMWYRIMAEGWNCHYFPTLYVYHQHRSSLKELQRQLFSYMRGHVSALLVQHENYQHKGNLIRLYKGFPRHFYYRVKNYLLNAEKRKHSTILTEIRGCISGWRFYQFNKARKRNSTYILPDELKKDAHTDDETTVSVIISCYNQGTYLKQAIDSVLQQTCKNVEIVVVDDGSEDNSSAICSHYGNTIKYVRVERVGLSAARNIGVQFSSGQYIVFLDADDFLYPNAIEINLYFFKFNKSIAFVSGAHIRTDKEGNPLPTKTSEVKLTNNYQSLLQGNYIAVEATVMYRRELFFYFHFDTQLTACEDYDLNLNITRHFPVIAHDKLIAAYRQHDKNVSVNYKLMKANALKVLAKHEKLLQNNYERKAYESGIKNWNQFYDNQTLKHE